MGLKLTGIGAFFDTVVTLDDVKQPKPDPEPVRLALSRLGCDPSEAIMVGDNYHDVMAGKTPARKQPASRGRLKAHRRFPPMNPIICSRK